MVVKAVVTAVIFSIANGIVDYFHFVYLISLAHQLDVSMKCRVLCILVCVNNRIKKKKKMRPETPFHSRLVQVGLRVCKVLTAEFAAEGWKQFIAITRKTAGYSGKCILVPAKVRGIRAFASESRSEPPASPGNLMNGFLGLARGGCGPFPRWTQTCKHCKDRAIKEDHEVQTPVAFARTRVSEGGRQAGRRKKNEPEKGRGKMWKGDKADATWK